ncbi:hypothetical protein I7I48_06191 [Histoplasma ohiense]|nr:hypothetical protein I7I48_06191 [Histoplasma ohiense (nom. inval.)]
MRERCDEPIEREICPFGFVPAAQERCQGVLILDLDSLIRGPLDMGNGRRKIQADTIQRAMYLLLFELCVSIFNIACSGALDLECTVHILE